MKRTLRRLEARTESLSKTIEQEAATWEPLREVER
jgi:hypothetical protein